MPTAWVAQKIQQTQRPDGTPDMELQASTTVYASDQIEATRLAQAALGTPNVRVREIPAEYGGQVPSDQEIAASWREIAAETQIDEKQVGDMRGAGGTAYG